MRNTARQDETLPDFAPDAGSELDGRCAPRFTLLIRAAKLISDEVEFLCVVRDASETGVSVRLFHPLPPGIRLALEMPNGDRIALERVWETEGRAGFSFREPVDINRIVEGRSPYGKRPLRVKVDVPCSLASGDRRIPATIANLSQQGALVCAQEHLSLIQRIKIVADGLPEIAAKVRWRRNDHYGLSFEDTFQYADLAALAFDLQRNEARTTAAEIPGP